MLEFVIKVCYHTISILGDIRAKMQHNASRMSLSDLVISALGPTALVLISLDQKNSFSRHSAASMHSSSPSMLISANNTLFECCMLYIVSIQMTADVGHVAHFDSADSRMQHPYGCCI